MKILERKWCDVFFIISAGTTLEEYVDLFDETAELISKRATVNLNMETFHGTVTGKIYKKARKTTHQNLDHIFNSLLNRRRVCRAHLGQLEVAIAVGKPIWK